MKLRHADNPAQPVVTDPESPRGKIRIFIASALGVAAFFFYRWVLDHYYLGDPKYYQLYYDWLNGHDLLSAFYMQKDYLGSSEVVYPIIAWIGSNSNIERNTLMAVFDGILYVTLFQSLIVKKANYLFIIFALTNFYVVVVSTSAERLKFSYIIFFIYLIYRGRLRFGWLVFALVTHFQSFITEGSIFIWYLLGNASTRLRVALIFAVSIAGGTLLYVFSGVIVDKIGAYRTQGSILDSLLSLIVLLLSLGIFKDRFRVLMAILPLIILTILLGSDRMNMILITVFVYLALENNKTSHPVVLLIMAYFSVKSVIFIHNTILYGNGFIAG